MLSECPADLQVKLTAIWERVMKTAPIAPDANFFDLGGDSLLAVSLLLEIERDTGHKLAITSIYDAPTIADQVELIESGPPSAASHLVPLKDGDGRPLFIVHGIGGTVMELGPLARAINFDGPVYGIQARGLDGEVPPIESIPEMARAYVDSISEIQASGPYLLAGYSFGGLVALEMARILRSAGDEDARVLMIDAYPHPRTWPIWSRLEVALRANGARLKRLAANPVAAILKLRNLRAERGSIAAAHQHRWPFGPDPSLPPALRAVHEAAGTALVSYVPEAFDGEVMFLKARIRGVFYPASPRAIWRRRIGHFSVMTVPGDHVGMIRVHYEDVARFMTFWIHAGTKPHLPERTERLTGRVVQPELVGAE